jgi:hypothetical protein
MRKPCSVKRKPSLPRTAFANDSWAVKHSNHLALKRSGTDPSRSRSSLTCRWSGADPPTESGCALIHCCAPAPEVPIPDSRSAPGHQTRAVRPIPQFPSGTGRRVLRPACVVQSAP